MHRSALREQDGRCGGPLPGDAGSGTGVVR
ncbi:DNA-binding protein [Xanthomonas hyacinthi]|nr:DNA-binding protein [Xanthomonas hyacinthi]